MKKRRRMRTKTICNVSPGALKSLSKKMMFALAVTIFQLTFVAPAFAQGHKVAGKVTDVYGETMIGVNVIVKNTTKGTVTNIDGEYMLMVNPTDTLQISFIGFNQQIIPVNGLSQINVQLTETATDLDEVVVVGYGQVKRANLLGSVSSISASEIEDIPATSLSTLLEGRLAGVSVNPAQPTGNPGAATRVTIRAETTFGESNGGEKDPTPLYIIDGFEVSQDEFDILDPSEIESFSVLKDASAAVYGSKGANGVILVKTKRGKEGKITVSYSGSVGVSDATTQTEMLSAYDQSRMINDRYTGTTDADDYVMSDEELNEMKNYDYDWLDQAWQKAMVTRHTINISGGTSKVRYFAGGNYMYTEGNFPGMGVGKYSYRLGIDANIAKNLTASATLSVDNKDYKRQYISGAGSNTMEDLFQALLQAPKWTPPYIDGNPVANNLEFNPLYLFDSDSYRRTVDKGNTLNLKLTYNFEKIKGLTASATYSRRESHGYGKDYMVPYNIYQYEPEGDYTYILSDEVAEVKEVTNNDRISENYDYSENYQLNVSLNYARKFGKHDISAFLTYEQSESESYGFEATTESVETYGLELQNAFQNASTDGSLSESGDLGGVFRLNYSYADKYLFESAMRLEATTKFAKGERTGLFPSASVGWVMSEENFLKDNVAWLNFLKLRFSMGLTGYASLGSYEYQMQYALTSDRYLFGSDDAVAGIGVSGKTDVVSSGVTWEKSRMHNLGVDAKFFDSKLGVSVDAYYTYQYDILCSREVEFAQTAGLGTMPSENLGRLEAWGYDMSISYRHRFTKDIYCSISGNFAYGTNRILETPTEYVESDHRYEIGQSTYAAGREEGYICRGMIRTQDDLDALNAEWNEKYGYGYSISGDEIGLGALYFEDIGRAGNTSEGEAETVFEPDGVIDEHDMTYVEKTEDKFSWKNFLPSSINIGFGWKDLRVSTLWTMAYGTTNEAVDKLARTVPKVSTSGTYLVAENSPAFWTDYWTANNPNAKYPSPYYAESNKWVSTYWMKDVYQLRLRNINVSYKVPKKFLSKFNIPELRLSFVGTNIWSPIQTFDYKEDAISRYNTYPLLRTFTFGLNVKI